MTDRVKIYNLGKNGIVQDTPAHQLAPEVWSNGKNMRFNKGNAFRILGEAQVFGTPSVAPSFALAIPGATQTYWIYTSLTKAYVYDFTTHTNITRVAGDYTTSQHRDWNGCILGGIPILNNNADVPQYWSDINPATPLSALPNWDATKRAKVLRNFGPYLVALNILEGSNRFAHKVLWSSKADPGTVPASWDPSDATVETGETHLTDVKGGVIQTAELLGNLLIIYKERSTHTMRFIGGNDVMGFDLLHAASGALTARSMCSCNNGIWHFVVSESDFYVHSGTKEIMTKAESRVRETVLGELDSTNVVNAFCFDNVNAKEVWFCYPTSGFTLPNKALVWNYRYDTWGYRDFVGIHVADGVLQASSLPVWSSITDAWNAINQPWSQESLTRNIISDPTNTKLWLIDSGYDMNGASPTSFLERTGIAMIGKDRDGNPRLDYQQRKMVTRVWPKIRGNTPITIRLGSQENEDDEITWSDAATYNPAMDKYVDLVVSGVLVAIRFESNASAAWQLEGYDFDMALLGEI